MKPSEIIQRAVDKLPDGVRENYVFGKIFLYDVIGSHITELKSAMKNRGILRFENKMLVNAIEKNINAGFSMIRRQMGEKAYAYTPDFLERFEDEFSQKLKVLFYTTKREYDRLKQPLSDILAHLSMIYLLSGFEIERTTWYAEEIQKVAGVKMQAVYDANITSIQNISSQLIKRLPCKNAEPMKSDEIKMAFEAFERELNQCKIEIYQKAVS
ncbi:MAG: hypothetical protein NC410_09125 [Oscillibacter sp.]|nr:hypothetical protein [Oscillibacter sp.]